PKGLADVDPTGPLPVTYATLDMLNKAARGETVAPEARKTGDRWLIYSAAPVRSRSWTAGLWNPAAGLRSATPDQRLAGD
ncbi:hypothetical protein, partial [Pseudomonas viridiflava]|uniref:hypothetical protein n=1 Tax=Pseudomonas viridiflava TaxID=33069 RepID=UPI001F14B3D7